MMIRTVGGRMFLLVLANLGSPRQRAIKQLLLLKQVSNRQQEFKHFMAMEFSATLCTGGHSQKVLFKLSHII